MEFKLQAAKYLNLNDNNKKIKSFKITSFIMKSFAKILNKTQKISALKYLY